MDFWTLKKNFPSVHDLHYVQTVNPMHKKVSVCDTCTAGSILEQLELEVMESCSI